MSFKSAVEKIAEEMSQSKSCDGSGFARRLRDICEAVGDDEPRPKQERLLSFDSLTDDAAAAVQTRTEIEKAKVQLRLERAQTKQPTPLQWQ